MNEIKTICWMCKKQLTAIEEYLNLAVCLPCKRVYWPEKLDRLWKKRGWRQLHPLPIGRGWQAGGRTNRMEMVVEQ